MIKYSLIKNNENTIKLLSTSRNLDTGTLKTNLKLTANSDIPKPVIENITNYYVYGDTVETALLGNGSIIIPAQTNHISLTEEFKNAIFNNLPFTDSNENT